MDPIGDNNYIVHPDDHLMETQNSDNIDPAFQDETYFNCLPKGKTLFYQLIAPPTILKKVMTAIELVELHKFSVAMPVRYKWTEKREIKEDFATFFDPQLEIIEFSVFKSQVDHYVSTRDGHRHREAPLPQELRPEMEPRPLQQLGYRLCLHQATRDQREICHGGPHREFTDRSHLAEELATTSGLELGAPLHD